MHIVRLLTLTFYVVLLAAPGAQAKDLILDAVLDCGFEPVEALFFVHRDGQSAVYPAALSELGSSEQQTSSARYLAMLPLPIEDLPQQLNASAFARAENGTGCFAELEIESQQELGRRLNYAVAIREKVADRRSQLGALGNEIKKSSEDIARLRQDARIIGRLGRIAQKESEIKLLEEKVNMLTQDLERLNGFLQQASMQSVPRNFVRRQGELTSQLEELATAGRMVEDNEQQRTQISQEDWQQNLALIEETRYDDINELTSQLEQLRAARIRSETQLAVGRRNVPGSTAADYPPAQTERYLP